MSEYSIFKPTNSRSIFIDYPELRKIEAFRLLKDYEMLFVWYYGCESSPFYSLKDERDRVSKCLERSYKSDSKKRISQKEEDEMLLGVFTPKIQRAIDEMLKFRVSSRIRSMMIIEKGFKNMESILDIDASDSSYFLDKDDEVDFAKKKAYVETLAKSVDLMPKLVSLLEGKFGLTKEDGGDDAAFEGESLIDNYHE